MLDFRPYITLHLTGFGNPSSLKWWWKSIS